MVFLIAALTVSLLYAVAKIYLRLTTGWCKSHTCLVGKTTIITGSNTGIGYETALDFAKRGARVILACRNAAKAEEARSKIVSETGNANVVVKLLDLSSFDSVRAFAKEINETENRLDILVNNAGVIGIGDDTSKDGLSLVIQINHFSGFLLTNLLISLLKKSAPSRVVNVSSMAAEGAKNLDLDKIGQHVSVMEDYCNSKLCNVLFTQELARKLDGTGVTTYSLHPGVVETEIVNNTSGILKIGFSVLRKLHSKTVEEGAQTSIFCSVAKGIENHNGEHFSDCKRVEPYKTARNPGLAKKLWEKSEQIVRLQETQL
ncbi:WW domain-containing oxidoreductase-like Protein [Tribolium castaneum]|uniref:WW domain-containing oxidoreductase-like Protein n=1 Tax=Tribolium castaneum TaxID=7070 RepID=D6X0B0_TRICA|nr:PREDICTED: retinol dehydrogenase 11 [Tribolium castaneum]EFA10517.1 WW domain-containing oxidoreductase-like Protein [Tribolium castaneum]|eukprot:XP_008198375.1 PREDICTED: retinol dehydrogenase 11 [Tribolium castaneum]